MQKLTRVPKKYFLASQYRNMSFPTRLPLDHFTFIFISVCNVWFFFLYIHTPFWPNPVVSSSGSTYRWHPSHIVIFLRKKARRINKISLLWDFGLVKFLDWEVCPTCEKQMTRATSGASIYTEWYQSQVIPSEWHCRNKRQGFNKCL